jgi:hypothetical protein
MISALYILFFLASGVLVPVALWAIASSSLGWTRYAAVVAAASALFLSFHI